MTDPGLPTPTREPEILFLDEWFLALDKPPGWFAHPTKLEKRAPDCQSWLMARGFTGEGGAAARGRCKPQPIHRLDRATEGILLFGLVPEAVRLASAAFQEQRVRKEYRALVRGWLTEPTELNYPLQTERGLQEALTLIEPLTLVECPWSEPPFETSRYTLLSLIPKTGRRHQLRRHMAHLRHPILGDTTHGDTKKNRLFARESGIEGLQLIACKLELTHPFTGETLRLERGLPPELAELVERYGVSERGE